LSADERAVEEAVIMTTMSVARIAEVLQHDFKCAANELRQASKRLRAESQRYLDAANALDRLAATVNDVQPNLLIAYHELIVGTPDRDRHAELLRRVAFEGAIKTASGYVSAYISDRTGGSSRT
jgi:hypothetical protein